MTPYISLGTEDGEALSGLRMDLSQALSSARKDASLSAAKGIDAMVLMSQGYISSEIGERIGASARLICAWCQRRGNF